MRHILLALAVLFAINTGAQTNLYVDGGVSASGTGTSWSAAFKTINEALNTVNSASTTVRYVINVAAGTYYPAGVQTSTQRDSAMVLVRGGVRILGGYPAGGGSRNSSLNPTIISGNIGSATSAGDNSYHLMVIQALPATADTVVIDGVSFRDGNAEPNAGSKTYGATSLSHAAGGGLVMLGSSMWQVQVNNCSFSGNVAQSGGGLYLFSSEPRMRNCVFTANTASSNGSGAGALLVASVLHADSCSFSGNLAAENGGALAGYGTSLTWTPMSSGWLLNGCSFTGNGAKRGGACFNEMLSTAQYEYYQGCIFTGNTATLQGGAIRDSFITTSAVLPSTQLYNSVLTGNTGGAGGAVYMAKRTLQVRSTRFEQNRAAGSGGGVYVDGTILADTCSFLQNVSGNAGGGIYYSGSYGAVLNDCILQRDTAVRGGGIYTVSGYLMRRCRLLENMAVQGGAINGAGQFSETVVSGNMASLSGGGVYCRQVSTFINSLFSGNRAGTYGGAVYDSQLHNTTYYYCTFAGDSAQYGNGLYNTHQARANMTNCIVWEGATNGIFDINSANTTISYSIVEGGFSGTRNSGSNPLFVAPLPAASAPTIAGNYYLHPCSPAIDSGTLSGTPFTSDLNGHYRNFGNGTDIGAYEIDPIFPSAITGLVKVCANATIQLKNPVAGGVWTSSNPSIATVNSSTGVVTGVSAGVDTIYYTASAGPCSMTVFHRITVDPAPAVPVISGRMTTCVKDTIQLSASPAATGFWSNRNMAITSVSPTGAVYGIAPGTDSIFYTALLGSCRTSSYVMVSVDSELIVGSITGTTKICKKMFSNLSNTSPGGVWTTIDPSVASISSSGMLYGASGGNTMVYYTITNAAGCRATAARAITVNEIDTRVQNNGYFAVAFAVNATYRWLDCDNGYAEVPGETNIAYYFNRSGNFAVEISQNGCADTSVCVSYTAVSVAGQQAGNGLQLAPNPAGTEVTISSDAAIELTELFDMSGRLLQTKTGAGTKVTLGVRHLPEGIYMISCRTAAGTRHFRLEIRH